MHSHRSHTHAHNADHQSTGRQLIIDARTQQATQLGALLKRFLADYRQLSTSNKHTNASSSTRAADLTGNESIAGGGGVVKRRSGAKASAAPITGNEQQQQVLQVSRCSVKYACERACEKACRAVQSCQVRA